MRLQTFTATGAFTFAVAAVAAWFAGPRPVPSPPPLASAPQRDTSEPSLGPALLRLAVAQAREGHERAAAAPAPPARPSSAGPDEGDPAAPDEVGSSNGDPAEEVSGEELLAQQVVAEVYPTIARVHFGAALDRQAPDPDWTNEVRTLAQQLLQTAELEGTQVGAVDCRETLCRLQLVHRDVEAEKTFWRSEFTSQGPWSRHLQGGPDRSSSTTFESSIYFSTDEGAPQFSELRARVFEVTEAAVSEALGTSSAPRAG